MRAAGVKEYEIFAHEILELVKDKPISFEVFADDFVEMKRQAQKIASWADNVYVKIPATNTKRQSSMGLVEALLHSGVKTNLTAVMAPAQVRKAFAALGSVPPSRLSL